MTSGQSIVEAFPYPWADPQAQELHLVLTAIAPRETAALHFAESVGIPGFTLTLSQPVFFLWRDILNAGAAGGQNRRLVTLVCDQNPNNPKTPFLKAILANAQPDMDPLPRQSDGTPFFISGNDAVRTPEALLFDDDLTESVGGLEALLETLRRMMAIAPAVCRLRVCAEGRTFVGTAFLFNANTLLTNHHVLYPHGKDATSAVADFAYETDARGNEVGPQSVKCDVASIQTDPKDDWGVIRLQTPAAPSWPRVDLKAAAEPRKGAGAFVIQHPLGARKRIGFVRNTVVDFDDRVVHYLTDTRLGSSGSPVFDSECSVVALHRAGGTPREVSGKEPITKNEGVRISRVYAALVARGLI